MVGLNFRKIYIYILSFFSGMSIMAVELSASRLMAPYFGTSTFVWTNIIGVIMIALAIGYILGGRLADKNTNLRTLLKLIIFACLALFLVPFFTPVLVKNLTSSFFLFSSATFVIFFGSLASIAILFFLPILLLGIVSPFLIKLLSVAQEDVGQSAGTIFGISTIGSILGTFLPILVFIPTMGTARTIIFFSSLLFIVALCGFFQGKYFVLMPIIILPWIYNLPEIKQVEGKIYETESSYQFIQVVDEGKSRLLQYNDGLGIQTVYNKESILTGRYYDYYSLLPYLTNKKEKSILIIGLAGGTIAKQLKYFFPDAQIDGVEIDQKVIDASRKFFDLKNEADIYNQDGRIYLAQNKKKYDIIIIDAYSNQLYIPFHLATKEFFEEVLAHLSEEGMVAMNVNAASDNSKLLRNITNTLNLVFNNTYTLKSDPNSMNYLVLGAQTELQPERLAQNTAIELIPIALFASFNFKKVQFDNNFSVLTDDKAPIEYLTDWMILDYVMSRE
jgi:spermidine synthase